MKNIKIINSKEYTLIKNEKSHKILIKQNENLIIINSRQYHLIINNPEEFYKTNSLKFKTLSDLYRFIISLFDRNKAYISSITNNFMNIILRMYEEKIELNLHFNNLIPDLINSPKNLTYDAFTYYNYDNSFLIYNSIMNNRLYIVYTTQDKSIIVYDVLDEVEILEIKNTTEDNKQITNFRYFYDTNNKRDLIISVIGIKNCLKF